MYLSLKELKSGKGKSKLDWKQIREIMSEKQKSGQVTYHLDFLSTSTGTLSCNYSRMKKIHKVDDN